MTILLEEDLRTSEASASSCACCAPTGVPTGEVGASDRAVATEESQSNCGCGCGGACGCGG